MLMFLCDYCFMIFTIYFFCLKFWNTLELKVTRIKKMNFEKCKVHSTQYRLKTW